MKNKCRRALYQEKARNGWTRPWFTQWMLVCCPGDCSLLSAPSVCRNWKASCYCEALTFSNLIMTKSGAEQSSMSSSLHQWVLGTFLWSLPFHREGWGGGAVPAFQSKTLLPANISAFKEKKKGGGGLLRTLRRWKQEKWNLKVWHWSRENQKKKLLEVLILSHVQNHFQQ